jgi:hypothetical protein
MFYSSCNSFCCKLLVAGCELLLACFKFYCSWNTGFTAYPAMHIEPIDAVGFLSAAARQHFRPCSGGGAA